jgi:hypothetical protein
MCVCVCVCVMGDFDARVMKTGCTRTIRSETRRQQLPSCPDMGAQSSLDVLCASKPLLSLLFTVPFVSSVSTVV